MGAMIGTGMLCQALPYQEGFGAKQIAWLVHSAVVGSVVAPLTLLGGPLMIRAACYTAGVVGGNTVLSSVVNTHVLVFTKQYNLVPCEGFMFNAPSCGSHSWVQ